MRVSLSLHEGGDIHLEKKKVQLHHVNSWPITVDILSSPTPSVLMVALVNVFTTVYTTMFMQLGQLPTTSGVTTVYQFSDITRLSTSVKTCSLLLCTENVNITNLFQARPKR